MDIFANFYFGWSLYNIIVLILLVVLLSGKKIKKEHDHLFIGIIFILYLLLGIFGNSITADYLPYKDIVKTLAIANNSYVHVEDFFRLWIPYIGNNYFLYLCIMNLLSLSFLYLIVVKLQSNNNVLFLLSFSLILLYGWIGERQSLFFAVYTLGILLLIEKKYIGALILFFLSFFLHKISYMALPILLLCFIPLRKKILRLIIFSFPILAIVCYIAFYSNMDFIIDNLGSIGVVYLEKEEGEHAGGSLWWVLISYYKTFVLYFLSVYLLCKFYRFRSSRKISILYSILFWTILISFFFYILLPEKTIANRCLRLGLIPMCYFLSVLTNYVRVRNMHRICFFLICIVYLLLNNAYILGVSRSTL
ncbi:EpsG family protein [uncultured Bacteroides sp.]|uniref:EpsG family protein n=1 Tax=uncultured Bacteroides sp. TaxID=162156 RepID=UPI00338D5815